MLGLAWPDPTLFSLSLTDAMISVFPSKGWSRALPRARWDQRVKRNEGNVWEAQHHLVLQLLPWGEVHARQYRHHLVLHKFSTPPLFLLYQLGGNENRKNMPCFFLLCQTKVLRRFKPILGLKSSCLYLQSFQHASTEINGVKGSRKHHSNPKCLQIIFPKMEKFSI